MGLRKVLTIEIGHKDIRICEMNYRHPGRATIYRSVSIKTPEDAVSNGYLKNTEDLGEYLSRKLKVAGLKRKDVVFTIDSSRVTSREIEIPYVKDSLVSKVVQAQVGEIMPMDLTDYIVSHTVLEKNKQENKIRLMVFAAPKDLIDQYYRLAETMAVNIESVDYVGNSMYQWMKRISKNETAMTVNVGSVSTMVTIIDNGSLAMQRTVATGTDLLLQKDSFKGSISFDTFDDGEKKEVEAESFGMSDFASEQEYVSPYAQYYEKEDISDENNEAENKNQEFELDTSKAKEIKEGAVTAEPAEADALKISGDEAEMLVGSLSRIIEYYTNRKQVNAVSKIYITGEGAFLQELEKVLNAAFSLPVEALRNLPGASLKKSGSDTENDSGASYYMACAGAALLPLDLIPYELVDFEQRKFDNRTYFVMTGAVAMACILAITVCQLYYLGLKQEKASLETEISEKLYIEEINNKYLNAKGELEYIAALDEATNRHNEYLNALFKELEDKLPRDAEITSITSAGNDFSMSFVVSGKKTAALLLMQLKQVHYVNQVTIGGLEHPDKVLFQVSCSYSKYEPAEIKEVKEEADND